MHQKETGLPGRERTSVRSQIKKLDEIILMTKNIKSLTSKSVIEVSETLRESVRLNLELPSSEITRMSIIKDRYLRVGAMQSQILELLTDLRTGLKNNL